MKLFPNTLRLLAVPVATLATVPCLLAQDETEDELFELSPFVVDGSDDDGYIANSSLAGSRLNSALKDTAAAIDVMTSELLADLGATDLEEAIEYATNSNIEIDAGGASDNRQFSNESQRIRIRGLRAARSVNYFPVWHGIDNYNIERIEESRGPNSILFGIGSPAGLINVNTKKAYLGAEEDRLRAQLVTTSSGGQRGSIDYNTAFSENFAVRINSVYSDLKSSRHWHAFKKNRAMHLAATFKANDNLTFRAEFERALKDQVKAKTRLASDNVSRWLEAGSPLIEDLSEDADLGSFGISGQGGRWTAYVDNDDSVVIYQGLNNTSGNGRTFYDDYYPELWDKSVNDGGPGQYRKGDYTGSTASMELKINPNTYLELAYNHAETNEISNQLADRGLRGSPNRYLTDGVTPNVGAGKLYVEGSWRRWLRNNDNRSVRATLSHKFSLGEKWGDYQLALMHQIDTNFTNSWQEREHWMDADGGGLFSGNIRSSANRTYRRHYIDTPGDWSEYYASSPHFGLIGETTFSDGTVGQSGWYVHSAGNPNEAKTRSSLVALQASYLDGRLVFGTGIRYDRQDIDSFAIRNEDGSFIVDPNGSRNRDYSRWDEFRYSGRTKTLGVVYHLNERFRLMFNHSDNFGAPNSSKRDYPDNSAASNPEGVGYDYGIGFSLFENRISGRIARFEGDSTNAVRFGYNLEVMNTELLEALVAAGELTEDYLLSHQILGNGSYYNQHVEGYELSLTANLVKNWRLTFRYSKTDGYQSDSYPFIRAYRDGDLGDFGGLTFFERPEWAPVEIDGEYSGSTIGEYIDDFRNELAADLLIDGVSLAGNRPVKANLFTRYTFKEDFLRGFYVGGGVKYYDALDLGFDTDSEGNPVQIEGEGYTQVDGLLGYNFGEALGLKNLNLQLNITNLLDDQDYIVTQKALGGAIRRVTYLKPQEFKLTANLEF